MSIYTVPLRIFPNREHGMGINRRYPDSLGQCILRDSAKENWRTAARFHCAKQYGGVPEVGACLAEPIAGRGSQLQLASLFISVSRLPTTPVFLALRAGYTRRFCLRWRTSHDRCPNSEGGKFTGRRCLRQRIQGSAISCPAWTVQI